MILITGGLGYIGSHANKELNKKGYETLTVDNLIYGHKEFAKWGKSEICDLSDIEGMKKIFTKYPIKAVMHFAAFCYVGESVEDPSIYYHNNVAETLKLLEGMIKANCLNFIFSLSSEN